MVSGILAQPCGRKQFDSRRKKVIGKRGGGSYLYTIDLFSKQSIQRLIIDQMIILY